MKRHGKFKLKLNKLKYNKRHFDKKKENGNETLKTAKKVKKKNNKIL